MKNKTIKNFFQKNWDNQKYYYSTRLPKLEPQNGKGAGILAEISINFFECKFSASVGAGILAEISINFEGQFRASV